MRKIRSQKATDTEANILKALTALSLKEFPNTNQAAKHFNISSITLRRRLIGGKSIAESRESAQLLSIPEEKALAQCITRLTASGFPVTHDLLQEMAEEIRQRRLHGINESSIEYVIYEPIGQQWTQHFIQHHPYLATAMSHAIELSRLTEISFDVIENWYNVLFETIDNLGISWRNIYNCDESGFGIGKAKTMRVIIDTEVKQSYQAEPGRQEWIT